MAALLLAVLSGAAGCDPDEPPPLEALGQSDGGLTGPENTNGPALFGVVSTDRSVTSISILRADGSVLARDFIHSGSATTGLVTALSGDVVLPTRSGEPGVLTLIDRFRTDVITRIDLDDGEVLGQVKTQQPQQAGDTAYSSNPQDWVQLDAERAFVSRFGPNPRVAPDDLDRGSDLLELDPSTLERSGRRIDFGRLDTEGERENADTGERESVPVYARPSRIVRLPAPEQDWLVVGLARLSEGYDAVGPGAVALVNLETQELSPVDLEGLENCGFVATVPDGSARVVVACSGFFRGELRDGAGVALLSITAGEAEIESLWRANSDPDGPVIGASVLPLGGSVVLGVELGSGEVLDDGGAVLEPARNDKLYRLDLSGGAPELIFEAQGRYVLGEGALSYTEGLIFWPDGSSDDNGKPTAGLRIFELGEDFELSEREVLELDPQLAPRQVAAL
ncbi:MAG: hypothetical protein OEZ06_19150 [Myxococcales bacterium]|nr:hypothetical protein [Myxococcales bacterium]